MSAHPDHSYLLSYYGDDFTGSTDVMESLTVNGVPAALFLEPPTSEELAHFALKNKWAADEGGRLRAFGVAGVSRSMSPAQMEEELPPIFERISRIPTGYFHYKTCSTFDSSPQIGSIGRAVDIAFRYFPSAWIPLLVAAPSLNRFCIFGNLFARVQGVTYRLDRHPTMSVHPVTPMHESDLRLHLAGQTERPSLLMDLFDMELEDEDLEHRFAGMQREDGAYVLFDILNTAHLTRAGRLMARFRSPGTHLLVGSSGIEYALCGWLASEGVLHSPVVPHSAGSAGPIAVMSGSASPVSRAQIEYAADRGFGLVGLDTAALVQEGESGEAFGNALQEAKAILIRGQSPLLHAALGPDDARIAETKEVLKETVASPGRLAAIQGRLLRALLLETGLRRAVVVGGDTSGYVSRALGIYALEIRIPVAPGAPLCTAHSRESAFDGMDISLKGGQNGTERYFEQIRNGEIH